MLENIYYFVDERGKSPVKEFIRELSVKERAKVFAYISELKEQGHNLRRPMADHLRDGIYELRPKDNRVFYFFFIKNSAVLVHAIKKHTDKIPQRDLELCLRRKNAVETSGGVETI
jgi:phage-related protein